jgi:hypothetical protein
MSWATPQDIKDRWVGSDVPSDDDLIQALIDDAEAVIVSEFPKIQERIDDEELPLQIVILVVSRVVSRLLRNPENLSYWQQQTGPFMQSRNYLGSQTDIWLNEKELALLSPSTKGKAFSVDIGPDKISPSSWPWRNPGVAEPVWNEWNEWY